MDPSIIYADGIQVVHSATESPDGYVVTEAQKGWADRSAPDTTDDYTYKTAVLDNGKPPDYVSWHTRVITCAQARRTNLQPLPYTPPPGVTPAIGIVDIPMDPAKIPAGYKLSAQGQIGGFALVPIAAPAASGSIDIEQRILKGEEEILDALGKPEV